MVHEAVDLPIYINETADAAFATRLRQTASTRPVNHLARVQYVEDDTLRYLSESSSPPNWPSSSRLKFLVNTAMETACKTWHIVRRSRIDKDVEALLRDPGSCHWLNASRIWALMAIGDAFSSRCTLPDQPFPGSKYWARAMTMERPRLCLVEVYLLLVSADNFGKGSGPADFKTGILRCSHESQTHRRTSLRPLTPIMPRARSTHRN
jgi:proline utilization trans-activator